MPGDGVETQTDEELLGRYQRGDARAFELLLKRHRAPLFTYLVRMVGDRAKAEDLAQETFVRIIKGAKTWEQRARFKTWLFTIARNLCVDHTRRERFRAMPSLDEVGPPGADEQDGAARVERVAGDGALPDRAAESARMRPLLARAIASLPDEQREVFVMREQAGMPFKEIAEAVGVNENTIKSRMRYALEGLRKHLEKAGVDADVAEVDGPATTAARSVR